MGTPDDTLHHAPSQTGLRVAFDVGPLYGHRTGVGIAVDGMLSGLRDRDDVTIAPYLVSFRSTPSAGHRKLPVPGIVASHLWSRSSHPRADRWLPGVDIVHGTNYVAPPTRLPTVISVYDCWFLDHPDQAAPLVRRAGRTLRRAVAAGAWLHTSSEATAEQARALLGTDRVTAIHLGPPELLPMPATRPDVVTPFATRPFVIAIGTEERRKGLPLLIRSFGLLAGDHPDPVLVLVGAPGDDSAAVDEAIAALPVPTAERVHRLGIVASDVKQWLLRHATVLAYPSLDEGFGFPILEAQLAGTPVVACDVGSVAEVGGESVVLVDDRSPEQFAEAIAGVLTSGRLGLIEAGNRNARRFSWDTTAERLTGLYRTVLEDR